jgi:FixJ family two-component response regulator
MPVIDGFALASRIRDRGLGWPVVMMTSDADCDVERRAAEHGVSTVLHKPVDAKVLADALDRAFSGFDG